MSWEPVRALLNPLFESYKLRSEVLSLESHALPAGSSSSTGGSQLSWKDLRSRARWNALVASQSDAEAAWIEPASNEVWSAGFETKDVKTAKVFDIPPVVSSDPSAQEPPSLASHGPDRYAIGDGCGSLHIISSKGQHLSAAHLVIDGQSRSFRLHVCDAASSTALLSLNVPKEGGSKSPAVFEVVIVSLPQDGELDHGPLKIVGRFRGDDIPSYAHCLDGQWLVAGDSPFSAYPPVQNGVQEAPKAAATDTKPHTAGYRWTQSADSVDIDIADLPATLKASDFKVTFSPEYVTMLISHDGAPRFVHRQLWAPVDASSCTWTWEAEEQLFSLHLEKKHVGTRWTALFTQVPEEGEVPETLSDQQLASITASLDKYTDDIDEPLDFESRAGLLGEDGEDVDEEASADTTVFTLLSPALQRSDRVAIVCEELPRCGHAQKGSVLAKRSYDGLLFSPALVDGELKWTHSTTYPALAFVLASKRNLRYRFHSDAEYALALDGGGLPSSSGAPGSNAYAYWPPAPGKRDKTATQAVVSLSGAICRGAVAIDDDRVAVLCEGELKVLSGFADR